MPLEDPSVIDIITRPTPGQLQLVITDSGSTADPDERYRLLVQKVSAYVSYVLDPSFRDEYPGVKVSDVSILVLARTPPTERMTRLSRVANPDNPTEGIDIRFQIFRGSD